MQAVVATITSDADAYAAEVAQACADSGYSHIVDGRFKGGYITRHYGNPAGGVQAVQLELAQLNYMDEETFEYDEKKAVAVQELISHLLQITLQ